MLEAVHSDKSDQGEVTSKIEMQSVSVDIWDKKYRLKKKDGNYVDETIQDTYERVAEALADVEPSNKKEWKEKFLMLGFCSRTRRHPSRKNYLERRCERTQTSLQLVQLIAPFLEQFKTA